MVKEFEINRCRIIYDSYTHIFGEKEYMELDSNLYSGRTEKICSEITIPAITEIRIHISNKCKLSCSYCYLKDMNWSEKTLEYDQLDQISELIERCSGVKEKCTISFLGAEPLDEFEKLKYLTEKLKKGKREYSFALSTNGCSLDKEKREYLVDNNFKIVVSIDGDKAVHDRFRHDSLGGGSYDIIINNLKWFKPKAFDVQSVITRNTANLIELTRHQESLNPNEIKYYFEVGNQEWTREEISRVKKEIGKLWEYLLDRFLHSEIVPLRHNWRMLRRIHSGNRRFFHCGAGITSFFIGNDMKIYPCNIRAYNGEELTVFNKGKGKIAISVENNLQKNVLNNEKCKLCWAKYLCGGYCHANKADICEILKYDNMYALYVYICMYKENKNLLNEELNEPSSNRFGGYIKKLLDDVRKL